MGERDENGKPKDQQEAELFEESLNQSTDDSADLFRHLQDDFEALQDESAGPVNTDSGASLEEIQKQVDAALAGQDPSLAPGENETNPTTGSVKTANDPQRDLLSSPTDAEEHEPHVQMGDWASDMNEADEVDGYFVQFSELANSASQQPENTHQGADEDLFMDAEEEDLFAGEPLSPAPEPKPMIHPLSPPAGKHGARRMIVIAAVALVAVAGGTIYWLATPESGRQTTTANHALATAMTDDPQASQQTATDATYPGEGVAGSKKQKKQSPAERAAAAEKILADARAAKAENMQAAATGTDTETQQAAVVASTTAEQIEAAKAELAAEKKKLADAEAVADKIRQAKADALREEQRQARAAAAAKQLAENKAVAVRKTAGKPATVEKRPAAQQVVIREHQPISNHPVSKKAQIFGHRQNKVGQLVVEYGALDGGPSTTPTAKPVTAPAVIPVRIDAANADKNTPAPSGQAGRWAVILTSASSDKSARQQLARMHELGIQAEIAKVANNGRVFHRIQIAGFASRLQAQKQLDLVSRKLGLHGAKIEKL